MIAYMLALGRICYLQDGGVRYGGMLVIWIPGSVSNLNIMRGRCASCVGLGVTMVLGLCFQ